MNVILVMFVASLGLAFLTTRQSTYIVAKHFYSGKIIYVQKISDNRKRLIKDIIVNFIFIYVLIFLNFPREIFYLAILYVFICSHMENIRELCENISTSYLIFELIFRLFPFILIFWI